VTFRFRDVAGNVGTATAEVTVTCTSNTQCDDGNLCTIDRCAPADSQANAKGCVGDPVICTALDQCHVAGVCDRATGQCSQPKKDDFTPCNDSNTCTSTDQCLNGVCQGTPIPDCGVCKTCDIDSDGDVDRNDVSLILAGRGAAGPGCDPRDANGDRQITVADSRLCALRCTRPLCAP